MLKEERFQFLLDRLDKEHIIKVSDIKDQLGVTEVTIRRDLKELEEAGFLTRIHGGAKSNKENHPTNAELSHQEKIKINLPAKREIAQKIAAEIKNGETIFLGSGSTIELACNYLTVHSAKIITNSIHIFQHLKGKDQFDIVLVGGDYRHITGAFIGTIANDTINNLHFDRCFVGVNGIHSGFAYTDNEREGTTERYILNTGQIKYLVADHSKFDKRAFYKFYDLKEVDYLITDSAISDETKEEITQFTTIL